MTVRHYIVSFLLLACNYCLFADDVRFTASVSRNQVATGEPFEISFSVNANGDRFAAPDFKGFQVLGGPNMSSSMTSVNGAMSVSISYSYYLMASNPGTYTIEPAFISVHGRTMRTNTISVRVVKGRAVPQQSRQSAPPPEEEDLTESRPVSLANSIFLRAVTDKNNVYQGQQVTVSYKLYTRIGIVESQVDKLPDLNGFWSEDIKNNNNQNVEWKIESYKGQKYHVAVVKQSIVFPDHSGDLTIDPLLMTFIVRRPAAAKSLVDEFFGTYEDVKYKVKSAPVTLHVRPLPETGKPAGFTGAVGRFSVSASVDKKELKANEALNYTLKVNGSGNLKLLKAPEIAFPPDFEKYDPKVTDAITVEAGGVSGSRTYTYLLIPRHEGKYKIDGLRFSWFNPSTNRYETAAVPSFDIKVNKGNPADNVVYSSGDKQDIRLLNKDISYIKTGDTSLYKEGEDFYGSVWYYILLLLSPVLIAATLLYRRWYNRNNSDPLKVKSRKAAKVAATHLRSAEKQLSANNVGMFYEAIFKGLYGYLSDKLSISAANINRDSINAELTARAVDESVVKELNQTLDLCEMARFAPVSGISPKVVFEKAKSIVYEIESKI